MKKKLLNNWILKIISLVFAFALWLIVINITNPVDEKTFTNVKVNLLNTDLITKENMVYEILDGSAVVKSVKVTAPRKVIDDLTSGDIVAEADFAKLTINNTIEIEFSSNRYNSEIRDISGNTEMVKLSIEEKKTKRLELEVATSAAEDGYIVGRKVSDPNRIEVSGPESIVSKIARAGVEVDVANETSDVNVYAPVRLYDADGNVISADSLTKDTEKAKVSIQILQKKEVPLEYSVSGKPADGYMNTGIIESDPTTVTIAGSASTLSAITKIVIPEAALDITGQSATMTTTVNIREFLPDNVVLVGEFNGKANVTVYIEKQEKKTLSIDVSHIRLTGIPAGFEIELEQRDNGYIVGIAGLSGDLTQIREEALYGHINIQEFMEKMGMEELRAGTYSTEVAFDFADSIIITQPMTVSFKITKTEE